MSVFLSRTGDNSLFRGVSGGNGEKSVYLEGVERCCALPARGAPWAEDPARFHTRAQRGVPSAANDLERR